MIALKKVFDVMSFYAVRVGRAPGIFGTWDECKAQISGFKGAKYKKFQTKTEAENFIQTGSSNQLHLTKNAPFKSKSVLNVVSPTAVSESLVGVEKNVEAQPLQFKTISKMSLRKLSVVPRKEKKTILIDVPEKNRSNVKLYDSFPSSAVVYTDGSCINNGGKSASAGIGVFWAPGHHMNISEKLSIENPTNQKAELIAAIRAIRDAKKLQLSSIEVRTDSTYTIKSMTEWMESRADKWKTAKGQEILNIELIRELEKLCTEVAITWVHVPAHASNYGNNQADMLARTAAENGRLLP